MSKFFEIANENMNAKQYLEILPNAYLEEIYIRVSGINDPVIFEKIHEEESNYNFEEHFGRNNDNPVFYHRISVVSKSFYRTILLDGKPKLFLDPRMLSEIDDRLSQTVYGKFLFYHFTTNLDMFGSMKSCTIRLKIYYGEKRV